VQFAVVNKISASGEFLRRRRQTAKIEGFLDQAATARVGFADANHFLYLCKANQLAAVDPAKIKAPALLLYAPNDLVFYEPIVRETVQKIAEVGGSVDGVPLSGPNGHLNGVFAVGQASDRITAFLAR
jgi:homoserine O-acetyltransferase/O-succinyltransferase